MQQFALPIEIIGGQTLRAPDGLALSSRNNFLSPAERQEAVQLSLALKAMAEALRSGQTDLPALEAQAIQALKSRGWKPDYLTVRQRSNLQEPSTTELPHLLANAGLVLLAAARVGSTRLIDNLEI